MARTRQFGLPLFVRELIGMAARRRTWSIRIIYAITLFLFAMIPCADMLRRNQTSPLNVLGSGRMILQIIVVVQMFGVHLFQPALACGAISVEKERKTFDLLLLTRLGPWTIIAEKTLSRLIPMGCLLLLSLPILALAYAMGGFSQSFLWASIWLLTVGSVQMTVFAVMCSAFFRSSTSAFVWTYLGGLLVFIGPIFLFSFLEHELGIGSTSVTLFGEPVAWPALHCVWYVYVDIAYSGDFWSTVLFSLPAIIMTLGMFCLARYFLISRAFAAGTKVQETILTGVDAGARRVTGGQLGLKPARSLPGRDPISWREQAHGGLTVWRYQFLLGCALATLIAAINAYTISENRNDAEEVIFLMHVGLWLLALLLLVVLSAGAFAGERSSETLDVLLTTPLTNREILRQKMRPVWCMALALSIPFAVTYFFELFRVLELDHWGQQHHNLFSATFLSCVLIYCANIVWLAMLFGLRSKSRSRAVIGSMAALAIWCIGPWVVLMPIFILLDFNPPYDPSALLLLLSPATSIGFNEWGLDDLFEAELLTVITNIMIHGGAFLLLRWYCLLKIDKFLKRASENSSFGVQA